MILALGAKTLELELPAELTHGASHPIPNPLHGATLLTVLFQHLLNPTIAWGRGNVSMALLKSPP